MNKERILEIANMIENGHEINSEKIYFNLDTWIDTNSKGWDNGNPEPNFCGTTACIAGWTVLKYSDSLNFKTSIIEQAILYLEIDIQTAIALFTPSARDKNSPHISGHWISKFGDNALPLDKVTPKQAASVMRNLVKTGIVDWTEVCKEHDGKDFVCML